MYNCLIANATRRSVNVNKNFILKYLNFASETKSEILVTVNGVTYIGKPLDPSTLNEVIRFKSTNFFKEIENKDDYFFLVNPVLIIGNQNYHLNDVILKYEFVDSIVFLRG